MYRTIKKVLIAVWLLFVVTNVWAQLYPIQVNLTAPGSLPGSIHSLYEANGLKGSIVLLDRYQPTLEVGIGVRIKGNNATIERRSDYLGDPLMLHYGTPVMLGEQVFAPIFQDGITYNGANRDEFERRGALSPGSYEILVWAYDPTRPQVRISNEARCIVWVQQSAPPTLIQPQPNAVVYALPQLFSWTVAQNFPGLNPTKYRFLLYELQDLNRAPESEVLSSEPLYEQELLMPTFAYSTMNAQLTRGKRYAWRIQALAQDMNGREVSLFSNNGFSPVRTFTYGQDAVEYLKKTFEVEPRVSSPYAAEVTWKNVSSLDAPDGMKVEYRKTGASEWQSIEADDEMLTLSQLTPDTEYDVRGIARTGAEYGEAGPVVKFRTQKIPEAKCGPTESYKPDPNSPKLASLVVGDIFTANRVPFVVEEAKGDGTFTGKATSAIPFFGGRKIMFKFSGIALNQKYELLSGSLVADTVGIEKFISKSLQEQNQKLANTLEKKGDLLASEDTKKIDGEIKDATSIKVDTANKQITVTLADGQETIVPFEGKPIIIADSGGKVYSVSDAGAVTSLGMYDGKAAGGATGSGGGVPSAKPQVLSGADLLVAFEAATNQRYGFDDPNGLGGQVWKEKYDEITVGGSKKMVPAKMVAAGSTDVVSVSLKGDAASSDLKDLSFVTSTGMRYTASPSTQKDRLDLTVMGGADASRQELTAWMKKGDSTYAVGRLSIDAYAKKSLRVVLVPVGDVSSAHTAQVATEVARIYRQAGVEVSVTDVPKLPMPEGVSDALKVDKSLMSCYSAGMRSIRSAFTKSETYRKLGTSNVYYLFLVSLPMNGEEESAPFDGYMPYGKPFGFVRSAGMGASELAWTIAHELGHGAFQLQHIWLEPGYDTYTKNLMGYSKTGELFRWQWEHIHHPVPHNNFGTDEEDLGVIKDTYYWTPAGTPIRMTNNATTLLDISKINNRTLINGILYSWQEGGVTWTPAIDATKKLFYGYIDAKTNKYYVDKTKLKANSQIRVNSIMYVGNCTKEDVVNEYTVPTDIDGTTYYSSGVPLITNFKYAQGTKTNRAAVSNCEDLTSGVYGQSVYNTLAPSIKGDAALAELKKIAALADQLGKAYFEGYLSGKAWDNDPKSSNSYFAYSYGSISKSEYTVESLQAVVKSLETYRGALETFKTNTEKGTSTKDEILSFVNNNLVFGKDFKYIFNAPFYELSANQRINIVSALTAGFVGGRANVGSSWQEEDIILEVFHTAKAEQHKDILDNLYKKKLLHELVHGVDGANYYKLLTTIVSWVFDVYPNYKSVDLKKALEEKRVLPFDDSYLFGKNNSEYFKRNGNISLAVQKRNDELVFQLSDIHPYAYILVNFKNNYNLGENQFVKGETYKLPALYVYMMFTADTREKWTTSARTVIDLSLLTLGATEIKAAIETGKWAKAATAVADLGIGFTDIAVNNLLDKEIKTSNPTFYANWQKISLIWGLGRLTQVGLEQLIKDTYSECQTLKTAKNLSADSKQAVATIEQKLKSEFGEVLAGKSLIKTGTVLDEAFESIASVQNLKKLKGVTVKIIDDASLANLQKVKNENKLIDELTNISTAEVNLNKALNKTDFSAHSGFDEFQSKLPNGSPSPNQNTKVFNTYDAPTPNGGKLKRHNDAEVKIFEDIASQLGAKKGDVGTKVFNDVEGKIKLKTELCPCGSCSGVIEQFKNMFPRVEIEIFALPKESFK